MLSIVVGATTLKATLTNNSSAQAFIEHLKKGPITINMKDYGNFEKFGDLKKDFPTNDEPITTEAGDIILSDAHLLVFYYAPNQWTFTRLGKFNDVSGDDLKRIFGKGSITATISLLE